jgi:hypothetical protein
MKWLIRLLFGCHHVKTTFPMTERKGEEVRTYVVCLECGEEFTYNWQQMRRVA